MGLCALALSLFLRMYVCVFCKCIWFVGRSQLTNKKVPRFDIVTAVDLHKSELHYKNPCILLYVCLWFFLHVRFLFFPFFSLSRFFSFVVHLAIMYSVLIQACSVWHGVGARFGCAVVSAYSPYFFWNYFCIVGFECSSPSFSLCVRCFFFLLSDVLLFSSL